VKQLNTFFFFSLVFYFRAASSICADYNIKINGDDRPASHWPPLFENVFHFTTRFFGARRSSKPISKWVCYADNSSSSFFFFENKSTLPT
jgi:hypothetical protein